nr:hypothetical protein [Candidatus Sigynarchaeota archaeon]
MGEKDQKGQKIQKDLETLAKTPDDVVKWSEVAKSLNPSNRQSFITFLQQNPPALKKFVNLMESDPKMVASFKISLNEMDSLEPYIENLKNLEGLLNLIAGKKPDDTKTGNTGSSVPSNDAPKKSDALKDIDADLEEIFNESKPGEAKVSLQEQLEELDGEDKFTKEKRESEYQELIRKASSKIYSYSDQDIDEVIELYKKAFLLKEGTAADWYSLAQAHLKRAQKKVGVFSYSFEAHYKDLTDFYDALNAAKKAVKLDPKDKSYWENLTMIYEIMTKKPMALYCARKTLEMQLAQEKRLSSSGLLGTTSLQGVAGSVIKEKVETLEKEAGAEIDPFDEGTVAAFESKARKEKIQKGQPLDHFELYIEAAEHYANGDIETTKNLLTKATKLKPAFLEPWLLLAEIKTNAAMADTDKELQHIEFSDATRCLERAIEINPHSIEPYKLFAKQYEFLDSRDNFIRVLDKIIELEPENWEYRKKLCDIFLEKGLHFHIYGDAVQADRFLHKAIDMYPYDSNPWKWLGKNYLLKNQFTEAIKALQESIRLEADNPGAKEGLIEAFILRAQDHEKGKRFDQALQDIEEIFSLDEDNDKASALQVSIVDDYCEMGFDALDAKNYEDAKTCFEKALSIKNDHPFGWIGIAKYAIATNDVNKALEAFNKALEEWNVGIINYNDEFVLQTALDVFKEIIANKLPYAPGIEQAAEQFKNYLEGFMNLVPFIHADHVHLGHVYVNLFQFFLELAGSITRDNDKNASKLLATIKAQDLPAHQAIVVDWKATRGTSEPSILQNRMLVLKDIKFFLDRFFNMFLFKTDNTKVNNIITFINYLRQDFALTIKEIYDALEFIENGQSVIRTFDLLATYTHVVSSKLRSNDVSIFKTAKPLISIHPNPRLDIMAVITKDLRLMFMTNSFQPLESAIFTGKSTKIKPIDAQWNPDGNKLLLTESKIEKRSLKSLIQHGNQVMMLDLTFDPMINPKQNALALDPKLLEKQIGTIELDQNTTAISWKDNNVFQALLKSGILMRWTLKEGNLDQKATRLQIGEIDLVAESPNQELIAILSSEQKILTYVNIRSDQVFKFSFEQAMKPISLKWDNKSIMAHFLAKKENGQYTIGLASRDGKIKFVAEFDQKDLNEDVFEPIVAGQHAFYLLRAGKKFIVTEASYSMWMEFNIEVDLHSVLERGILNMQWASLKEIRFFMDDAIIRLDLTPKIKQMLSDRITFLERFPRSTFIDKATWLKDMRAVLE